MSEIERKIFVIERSKRIPFLGIWSPFGRKKTELPKQGVVRTVDKMAYLEASQSDNKVTVTYDMREITRGSVLITDGKGGFKRSSYYEEEGRYFHPSEYLRTSEFTVSPRKRINLGKILIRSERLIPFTWRRIFRRG